MCCKWSREKLLETLNESEKEIFKKFTDARAEIDGITHYEEFTYGLKLGVLLMVEVFTSTEQLVGGHE